MYLDISCLFIILVWAVFGYRRGFVRRLVTLIGMFLAVFCAAPAAEIIENVCASEFNITLAPARFRGIFLTVTAVCIYLICILIGKFLHNVLVKGIRVAEKTNHILGASLGIVEATVALYFILCVTATYHDKITHYIPAANAVFADSHAFSVVKTNNILPYYNFVKRNTSDKSTHETKKSDNENS